MDGITNTVALTAVGAAGLVPVALLIGPWRRAAVGGLAVVLGRAAVGSRGSRRLSSATNKVLPAAAARGVSSASGVALIGCRGPPTGRDNGTGKDGHRLSDHNR